MLNSDLQISVPLLFIQDAPLAWITFNKLGRHFESGIEDSSPRGSSDRLHGKNSQISRDY